MKLSAWIQEGTHFNYRGHKIFYQEAKGDREVLLLLHGFPTSSWDWNKIWDKLAEQFHLIAPDFIGYGLSDKPKSYSYSTHDQADLVEVLLQEKEVTRVHVLAHDFGDTVLQELLARRHERETNGNPTIIYQSICLLNGGIIPEGHQPRPIQKALISPLGILLTPFLNRRKLKKNFHEIFGPDTPPSDQEIDEFYYLIQRDRGKYVFHKLIRYMADRQKYRDRWVGALQACKVPLCMINGNMDPVSGKHLADRARTLFPNMNVIDLPTIGHYPQTEAPDQVLQHFEAFHRENKTT